mgnify:FL=1
MLKFTNITDETCHITFDAYMFVKWSRKEVHFTPGKRGNVNYVAVTPVYHNIPAVFDCNTDYV